ncbi:asparagine synthase (glutamine-hydrolyzing) [Nitrospinota bacterium]
MCGLAGFITSDFGVAKSVLDDMLSAIIYRGPDDRGAFFDGCTAFGHVRLTIIDPEGGAQPRVDHETGDVLIFNGEIYAYRDHAKTLACQGVILKDRSDTEVLFEMIRNYGLEEALRNIDGMFAFVYKEGRTGNIYLVRDRFGEKPLYYSHSAEHFIFGSEIKALRRHPALQNVSPDVEAIHQYLTFEYVPGSATGFSGIKKVLPGEIITFRDNQLSCRRYWEPAIEPEDKSTTIKMDEAIEELDFLIQNSIRERLIADVPVGVFLSGGVDSSMVAIAASQIVPDIKTFTVRMPYESYDETPYAVEIAQINGIRHEVIDFSETEVHQTFQSVVSLLDEPMADSSLIPSYLVCKGARESVKVSLGGDGADEIFGGYLNFQAAQFAPLMAHLPKSSGNILGKVLDSFPASSDYMGLEFKLRQLSKGFGHPPILQNFLWLSAFDEEEKKQLWRPDVELKEGLGLTFKEIHRETAKSSSSVISSLIHLFKKTYLPNHILSKMDRASMYNSLEVRSPMLAKSVEDFTAKIPNRWKVAGFNTKVIFKKLAEQYMSKKFVYRRKHGFAFPISELMRGALKTNFEDTILNPCPALKYYFELPAIERIWREHQQRSRDHRKKLYTIYVLFCVFSN